MKADRFRIIVLSFSVALLLSIGSGAFAQGRDFTILQKALKKALGEETNYRTARLVALRQESREGKNTLMIAVNANRGLTQAALRNGVFKDVTTILRILKSWDWPQKVDQTMIGAYYPVSGQAPHRARPILLCLFSSDKVRETDWDSFDPKKVPDVADALQLHDMLK